MLRDSVIISEIPFLLWILARTLVRSLGTKPRSRDSNEKIEESSVGYCQQERLSQASRMWSGVEFLEKQALLNIMSLVNSRRCVRSSLRGGQAHKCSHVSLSLPQRTQFQSVS